MLGSQPNHGLATLLSSKVARWRVGLQTLWQFLLKDLSIDEIVGTWCFGCCTGQPVRFHLLWYSVIFDVEFLSLLYLYFISWFICSRRWFIYKLGVYRANQTSMFFDPYQNYGWGWRRETGFSPPVFVFLLTIPWRCFFCGSLLLVMLHVGVCCNVVTVLCSLVVTC